MTTLTLQPDGTAGKDCYIYQASPTFNYGIDTVIATGRGNIASQWKSRSLLQFDISSIPAGSTVSSATLTLVLVSEIDTSDRVIGAHRGLVEWFEGSKNNAAPSAGENASVWGYRNSNGSVAWAGGAGGASGTEFAGTATDSKTITTPGASYDFNVLADVAAWVAGTATNYGWWLINTAEGATSQKNFASSDNATAGNRPRLVIEYTAASGDATVIAVTATADAAGIAPTISAGSSIAAVAAQSTALAITPSVQAGSSVTGTAATASAQAIAPTVSAGANATVSAVTATASAEAIAPTLSLGAGVSAVAATCTVLAVEPSLSADANVAGATGTASASMLAPGVYEIVALVALTLLARSRAFTLNSRDTGLTLEERSIDLTLPDR
jgi:hypothetical protein